MFIVKINLMIIKKQNMKSKYSILKKMLLAAPVLALPALSVVACGSDNGGPKEGTVDRPMGFFSPYQDMGLSSPKANLNTIHQATGQNNFSLAFLNTGSTSDPLTFAGNNWVQTKKKMVDPGKNTKYIVSTGGQKGPDAWEYYKDGNKLGDLYYTDLKAQDIHYLDFDIESDYANLDVAANAAKKVLYDAKQDNFKMAISLTVGTNPNGLTAQTIQPLEAFIKAGVMPTLNLMTMNYGTDYIGNMADYAISAVTGAKIQYTEILKAEQNITWSDAKLWGHLGCTNMIGVNDTTKNTDFNIFRLDDAAKVVKWAQNKNLGFLGIWEASRDHPATSASSVVSTENSGLEGQADYAFINAFKSFV